MEAIFLQILNMSMTGSYIILAVMILRLFLKKSPKKYSYLMWAVCAFRLCCPMSFKNTFSIFNLRFFSMSANSGASLEHIPQNIGMMQSPQISTWLNSIDGIVNSSLPAPSNVAASVNPMQIIIFIAAVIWLAGIAALLLYSIISYIILRIKLRNSVIYKKNVYQSDKINTPFVFGLISPKIYIPFGVVENEMRYVLAHEQYHIKRRDYIIKPIAFLILVIHWFNPLCWIAFILMSCDMEMSCDEKVLSSDKAISKEYSTSLLSFAAGKRPPTPCPLAFGETGIRGRIKNILKYKKPKAYVSIISILLCAAAIVAFASNPKSDDLDKIVGEDYIVENKTETQQDAFSPQDIYDLADVQLIVGQNSYSILDKSNLTEIEEMFSNAEEIKFATGCPFDAVLKMTRTDGTEGIVILASDSCAVYKSNDVYYDYSDGDNSRLLSMFGIDTLAYTIFSK